MTTYHLTCEWSGPRNPAGDHTRHVHSEFIKDSGTINKAVIAWAMKNSRLYFTDGTFLLVRLEDVTRVHHSKRAPVKYSYMRLLRDCAKHSVNRVEDLPRQTGL